jgi:hypothetical protein
MPAFSTLTRSSVENFGGSNALLQSRRRSLHPR